MAKLTSKLERTFPIPGDPDGAKLKIVHLKPGEIQRVESETTRWVGKSGQNSDFATELEFDPATQARKLRIAAVTGWKGFYDEHGAELEFTKGNLAKFLDEDPKLGEGETDEDTKRFSEWIDEFRKTLADELKPQEVDAEKNS